MILKDREINYQKSFKNDKITTHLQLEHGYLGLVACKSKT